MYPQFQPVPYRSAPAGPVGDARFIPFFGFPFLAGLAGGLIGGGLIGGALAYGPRPPYYPPYPPASYPCAGYPCQQPYYY